MTYDNGLKVSVLSAKRGPKDQEGYPTVLLTVKYVNNTASDVTANFDDWYVEAADGTRYDTGGTSVGFYGGVPNAMGMERVAPGRTFVGLEAIRVPASVKPVRAGFAESSGTYGVADWKLAF